MTIPLSIADALAVVSYPHGERIGTAVIEPFAAATLALILLAIRLPGVSLLLAVAGWLGCFAYAMQVSEALWFWYASPSLVIVLLAIVFFRGSPDRDRAPQLWAKGLLIFFAFCLVGFVSAAAGPFGVLLFALFAGTMIHIGFVSKRVRAARVVSVIAACMRQNLPLNTALPASVDGSTSKEAIILRKIAQRIEQGDPLGLAVRRGYPKCPGNIVGMLAAAEQAGQLAAAFNVLEAELVRSVRDREKLQPVHPVYPLVLLLMALSLISGLAYFVLPKFQVIFRDYHAQLPPITQFVFGASLAVHNWAILLFIAVVIGLAISLWVRLRPRQPDSPLVLSRIGDFLKWHTPVLHWFERNHALHQTVESLRMSLNAGCTVDAAISHTTRLDLNECFRRNLVRWKQRVERGDDVGASARACGLGRAVAWAFDSRVNSGNAPAVLEMLHAFYRANYGYCANLLRLVFWPCTVMGMALMIGFVVLAIFMPLVTLIQAVASMSP